MKHGYLRLGLAVALAIAGAEGVQAKGAPVTFSGSGKTTVVDCQGADLAVTGSGNRLQVRGCDTVQVMGDNNRIQARLIPTSSIAAFGDGNWVSWTPAPGSSPQVSSTGRHNEINPVFSARDSAADAGGHPAAPISAPPG